MFDLDNRRDTIGVKLFAMPAFRPFTQVFWSSKFICGHSDLNASGGVFGATILSLSANDYIELYMRSVATNSYYGSTGTGELSRFEGFKLIT